MPSDLLMPAEGMLHSVSNKSTLMEERQLLTPAQSQAQNTKEQGKLQV